jgi:mannan endo-1,4-beta-mannosidase
MAYGSLELIEQAGANAVRIGWGFESINPVGTLDDEEPDGELERDVIGTNPLLLAEILYKVVSLGMIPIVAVNDSTGQEDPHWPATMAELWVEDTPPEADVEMPSYLDVIKAYEGYLFVGIANEWRGSAEDFQGAYEAAIDVFRDAGVTNPLVITANEWGQGCQDVYDLGQNLLDYDSESNLVFDLHLYTYLDWDNCRYEDGGTGEDCGADYIVEGCLDGVYEANLPVIVGEYGNSHSSGEVAWEEIVARTDANSQGRLPWIWFGDTEYPVLNMNEDWDGPLTSWGESVTPMGGTKATIF